MGAFSAYEFLNVVLSGMLIIVVGFNGYLPSEGSVGDAVYVLSLTGAGFLLGHLCAGLGSWIEHQRRRSDERGPSEDVVMKAFLDPARALDYVRTADIVGLRAFVVVVLEVTGRDSHLKMLSQQETLHRNLAAPTVVTGAALLATGTLSQNAFSPWLSIAALPLALFFYHRYSHFERRIEVYLDRCAIAVGFSRQVPDAALPTR